MELTYTERNGVMYPDLALPEQTNYPIKSATLGMIIGGFWYAWTIVMWMGGPDFFSQFHTCEWLAWEPDEIGIIMLYLMYIPMMIGLMKKAEGANFVKRYLLPFLGILCCLFFCYAIWVGYGYKRCIGFLVFFAVVEVVGFALKDKKA